MKATLLRYADWIAVLLLAAAAAALTLVFLHWHLDHTFITYRTARNLAAGRGLAYNAGQATLSAGVSPLYAALLAAGSRLLADLPRLGNLISGASIGLSALALYGIIRPQSRFSAAGAALLLVSFPLLWLAVGLEITLWLALALAGGWLHLRGHGFGAGLVLGLATLLRPETGIWVFVLVADSLLAGKPLRLLPAAGYAAVVAGGVLWVSGQVEGGPLLTALPSALTAPTGAAAVGALGALAAAGSGMLALSPLWAAVLWLAIVGAGRLLARGAAALRAPDERWAVLLAAWAVLHLLVLAILDVVVVAWLLAPVAPALAALAMTGAEWLAERFGAAGVQHAVLGLAALLVIGAASDSVVRLAFTPEALPPALAGPPVEAAWAQAGAWLRDESPPGARVGTTRIGTLGFVSGREIVDYEGRLQPQIAAARQRGDDGWWLAATAPDYLVLGAGELDALGSYQPRQDPWFTATYGEVARTGPSGEVVILERTPDLPPLVRQFVGAAGYPEGVVLNSIATDFSLDPLEGGRQGRIALEWLLNQRIDGPRYVSVAVRGREGVVAALGGGEVDFASWPTRELITTFHSVELAAALLPGVYDVQVGLGPDPSNLTWHNAAVAKVPFPAGGFVGAVSGTRTEFGKIALVGYRLARTPEGLEVALLWQALDEVRVDYRVFVQVRDAQGAVRLREEFQPHDGAYPTSVWASGEQVPDSRLLDVSGLPPDDYEVFAGLLDPDGERILTVDGRDTVRIGQVSLTE